MTVIEHKQLFEEVDTLPIDIKTKLLERLLLSVNYLDKDIDSLWLKEAKTRKDEIQRDRSILIDGKKVFESINKRFSYNLL